MAGWSVRRLVPCRALSDSAARRQVYEEELQRQAAQHEARKRARYGASHQHRPFSGGVPSPPPPPPLNLPYSACTKSAWLRTDLGGTWEACSLAQQCLMFLSLECATAGCAAAACYLPAAAYATYRSHSSAKAVPRLHAHASSSLRRGRPRCRPWLLPPDYRPHANRATASSSTHSTRHSTPQSTMSDSDGICST